MVLGKDRCILTKVPELLERAELKEVRRPKSNLAAKGVVGYRARNIVLGEGTRMSEEITVWASISTTIKTRDYENIKLDFGIAGVPSEATPENIAKALQTVKDVNEALANELSRKLIEEFGR